MFKRVPFTPGDLTDHQQGTDDTLTGVTNSTTTTITNLLIGDAGGSMFDFSKGGDDTFFGGFFNVINTVYGDAVGRCRTAVKAATTPSGAAVVYQCTPRPEPP